VSRCRFAGGFENTETEIPKDALMTRGRHIQHAINIIYNQIFNQGRADLLRVLFPGHTFSTTRFFLTGSTASLPTSSRAGSIPCEVKRGVAIDGGSCHHTRGRYLNWAGKETAGVGHLFASTAKARSSSIGMSFNPSRPPPTTATRCFEKNPAGQKVQRFRGTLTRLGSQIVPSHNGFPKPPPAQNGCYAIKV